MTPASQAVPKLCPKSVSNIKTYLMISGFIEILEPIKRGVLLRSQRVISSIARRLLISDLRTNRANQDFGLAG
jgi:hypothetical protein